ncbi:Chromatin assembly complex, subunit 3 [Desmophyllum pertusum]|uniref:Chromatin assembly complex, subunit 3 n=1 Tax=Desmophyllum pertusum TaxID=174260 RepID=A0A9W9ZUP9_9CNID|nr:Chromatin assembly complex, subunit 3 [Desmophyllum pertusum]
MEADSPQPSGASKVDLPNDPGKMFVGGLSWETTAEGLQAYFSKYGDLKECLVMRDPNTKQSRGFGFVTFEDPTAVEAVLKAGPHELDHKKIDPKVAVPKRPQPKMVTRTKKIFVGGVSASTTEEDLTNYFKQHGPVSESKLMFDKVTHRHRGFGFVTFDSEDAAESACEEQFHLINDKKTEVKKAQPREVMQSLQGGRGRAGRTLAGRGFLYNPFAAAAAGFPRGFAPSSFGPGFSNYPFPGYSPAAAAAAAAFAVQNRPVRGKGRGYLGNYPGMLGFPGYPPGYMNTPDQRRTPGVNTMLSMPPLITKEDVQDITDHLTSHKLIQQCRIMPIIKV